MSGWLWNNGRGGEQVTKNKCCNLPPPQSAVPLPIFASFPKFKWLSCCKLICIWSQAAWCIFNIHICLRHSLAKHAKAIPLIHHGPLVEFSCDCDLHLAAAPERGCSGPFSRPDDLFGSKRDGSNRTKLQDLQMFEVSLKAHESTNSADSSFEDFLVELQ